MNKNKVVVTTPAEARTILRSYLRSNDPNLTTVPGSRAKWASVAQVAEGYDKLHNQQLDRGWFGRSLNEGINNGSVNVERRTVNGVNVYRTL